MRKELYGTGDIYVSEKETLQFHKGMSYEINNVYHLNGILVATINDKWGNEVLFKPNLFSVTGKTNTIQMHRHLKAMLEFWFNNNITFTYWKGWKDPSIFYKASFNSTYSSRGINMEGSVFTAMKFRKDVNSQWEFVSKEPTTNFLSKQECIDYYFNLLKNHINEDFYAIHIEGLSTDIQESLNLQTYILMNGINNFSQNEQNDFLNKKLDEGGRHTKECQYEFDKFISFINELIFDHKKVDSEVKKYIKEIIELFMVVPSSWAATACANVLLGKGKVKNEKTEPFWEKFVSLGLKMPQVFELVDHVDSFMYEHKVFQKKEDYSSAPEWRGNFEFIGNKYIDKTKLKDYLNY